MSLRDAIKCNSGTEVAARIVDFESIFVAVTMISYPIVSGSFISRCLLIN